MITVIDKEDVSFFRKAMQSVTALGSNSHRFTPPQKFKIATTKKPKQIHYELSDQYEPDEIRAGDVLSYRRSGISTKIFRKLRNGKFYVTDQLDLHGLTVPEARKLLTQHLNNIYTRSNGCICIVHGKGHRSNHKKPVLKSKVNHWLKQHPRILAFHSAISRDGGTGAVYVLLKNAKNIP